MREVHSLEVTTQQRDCTLRVCQCIPNQSSMAHYASHQVGPLQASACLFKFHSFVGKIDLFLRYQPSTASCHVSVRPESRRLASRAADPDYVPLRANHSSDGLHYPGLSRHASAEKLDSRQMSTFRTQARKPRTARLQFWSQVFPITQVLLLAFWSLFTECLYPHPEQSVCAPLKRLFSVFPFTVWSQRRDHGMHNVTWFNMPSSRFSDLACTPA